MGSDLRHDEHFLEATVRVTLLALREVSRTIRFRILVERQQFLSTIVSRIAGVFWNCQALNKPSIIA